MDLLPEVMLAYKTSIKTPTGHTLFSLAIGLEAIAPSELVWPTSRIVNYEEKENKQAQLLIEDLHEQKMEET